MSVLKAKKLLARLEVEASRYQILSNLRFQEHNPVFVLLRKFLVTKQQRIITSLLTILEKSDDEPNGIELARRIGIVAQDAIVLIFQNQAADWQQRLSRAIFQELHSCQHIVFVGGKSIFLGTTYISSAVTEQVLKELLHESNSVIQAASLYALNQFDSQSAKTEAHHLLSNPLINELVQETALNIVNQSHPKTSTLEQLLNLLRQEKYQSLTIEQLISFVTEIPTSRQNTKEIALTR
ncbi:hypothetical protein [Stanieria cyanosphaera]|uniref:hypothetical protein n=1 Tax=Stanieria cyanosphaera TaxID=102116 RepID=UPI00031D4273|nr:hypothetical protein [Stanieria cyanosphaera]